MNFHILTLFPDMVMGGLGTSITGRAMESKTIFVEAIDIRDYTRRAAAALSRNPTAMYTWQSSQACIFSGARAST